MMPNDLPPWEAVYQQTRRWLRANVFETIMYDLHVVLRLAEGRTGQPSAAILNSCTLQSMPESGPRAGYDGGKRKRRSKVHMAVETLGYLLALGGSTGGHVSFPLACWIVSQALARKSSRSRHLTAGEYMSDPREGEEFFLNVPERLDNPFPDLKYFREQRPVFYYPPLQTWFIFRYDDVSTLFHDTRLSADRMKGFVDAAPTDVRDGLRTLAPAFERWVLMKDGQDHARLRQFLNRGFNVTVVHSLRGLIQQSVEELLDRAQDQGHIDASGDFAFLLPAYVLSDLLGVHQEDRGKVVQWSVDFVDFFNVVPITVATTRRMTQSATAMNNYTKQLLAERRAQPQADFLGTLINASAEEASFTDEEIIANAMLLLLAAHVAVRNLIGNALYLLLTHPNELAKLQANSALMHNIIEETLRYEPPVTLIPRIALEGFELHGNAIRQGRLVQLNIASANRDSVHFPDAERSDISRPPGNHLSFGHGPHGCLGASLAREQASIALTTLLQRFPRLRLDVSQPIQWYRNAGNRGPITLPLIL
jgi:cytochrome P450